MRKPTVTDYNHQSKLVRTAKWWYAPESVSRKSKAGWGFFLGIVLVGLIGAVVVINLRPDPDPVAIAVTPAPEQIPVLESPCPAQDPKEVSPETLILTKFSTTWARQADMVTPSSPTGGPTVTSPYPSCFARSPEGALYSAANFASGLLAALPAGDQKAFYTARTSHTGNYSVLMADLPSEPQVQNRPTVAFSGYRWNSYTPDTASIEIQYQLITGSRAGTYTAITYSLTWENNDWLLVVPGKSDSVVVAAGSAHTYIPWGGS